jgi:UDP-N-acetylglucosamine/UDP-N-acetylgalactosamine diphosphorylase
MTSDKNNDETIAFFEEKNYFGYPKDYVKFFKQEMAPSVDFNGKLYMESPDSLSLSPNGNGGWFYSMAVTGVLNDVKARGVEWLNIFAVDNVLQRIADPVFVGATLDSGRVSGAKVVRKAEPHEKVGVLCLEDGKPSIVEYYEMTDEIINSREPNGDLSYNFGVILNYLFRVDKLEEIMNTHMPVHIVEKKIPYINEAGEYIKPETPNGYKFELLVLDMIHLLDNCLSFEVVRDYEFAPIKNKTGVDSVESAQALLKKNGISL